MRYNPWPYQAYTTGRIIDDTCGPLLDMGLGKTVATLTAMSELLKSAQVKKILVIAPLRIADEVWSTECQKWDHLRHLRISKILGKESRRKAALLKQADIYIINRENLVWLVAFYGTGFPFDTVIIDESSSFKDPSSKRFKALRKVAPLVKRKYILTGTPIPNGLLGLWSQIYFLDRGQRLGDKYTAFRDQYFEPAKRNRQVIFQHQLKKADELLGEDIFEKEIHEKIGDICFSMKAKDYLTLPERFDLTREITFAPDVMEKYLKFERDQVLGLTDEKEITALSAAALTTKLLQFSSGAVYDENKAWHEVHHEKLIALEEIVEAADGHPVLVFYNFKHAQDRITARLKKYKPVKLESSEDIQNWNDGKIQLLLAHPASAGHGLNLQAGGNIIVWYDMTWSLEQYQQANARLHRQGQTKPVIIHRLIATGTMDGDVLDALDNKADKQEALMRAVKARIEKYRNQ